MDINMRKYEPLWRYVAARGGERIVLRFDEIEAIIGVPIDHSFLRYKRELLEYGYQVGKISLKEQKVSFEKC